MGKQQNILVVGTGISGATVARKLAEVGHTVTIIDQRNHIAGNCYDEYVNGVRVHQYGSHIFHTNNDKVFSWLSQFTEWTPYQHKVKALYNGQFLTLPPNRETKNILGDKLIDVIYRPYTKKMWTAEVDQSILNRVKPRDDDNELYFPDDKYQFLPKNGYTKMVENILQHENITVKLNTKFDKNMEKEYNQVFSCSAIDEYYDYCFGHLPYRSIKFTHVNKMDHEMPTSVVNYTDDSKYTRVVCWKNFPNHGDGELYTLEEPVDYRDNNFERYYPVKDKDGLNRELYKRYRSIENDKVTFIGRCGLYAYLDMDMACSNALSITEQYINRSI